MNSRWFAPFFALAILVTPARADDKPKDEKSKSASAKKLIKLQGYTTVMVEGFTVFIGDETKSPLEDEQ